MKSAITADVMVLNRWCVLLFRFCAVIQVWLAIPGIAVAELQAGAAVIDVTPTTLPVIVNGGMTSRTTDQVTTRLKARSLAIADGTTTIVLVVVDSCMMPRDLIDEAKDLASRRIDIPASQILVSATHTHTAGSCMAALGTPADENYVPFLKEKLADAIVQAVARLQPAEVGWASVDAPQYTALRRWIHRPGHVMDDPFGNPTVRANMHSARDLSQVTGPSGPEDPQLSLISFRAKDGQPLAVLANFSMHYFSGEKGISADYFGYFCQGLQDRVSPGTDFVAIMSHGCSGDIWRRDYADPDSWNDFSDIRDYASGLAKKAAQALEKVSYSDAPDGIRMSENRMVLDYRVPDVQRLAWARDMVAEMGDRLPKTKPEVYAQEQIVLHERQRTEVVTQAIRIGDIAIASTPNETYAITGLKIKAASPLEQTMVIELANGGDGYIPPPEQHLLGGYNTWAARSAGLEVEAEPRITEACIGLLESVTERPRRVARQPMGPAAETIRRLNPYSWYRLDEFRGPVARDSSGNRHDAFYEPEVAFFLSGPKSKEFSRLATNRAVMFAGGRLQSQVPEDSRHLSVSLWFWNGMPEGARDVSGWLFSQGPDYGLPEYSTHLGVMGSGEHAGCLVVQSGSERRVFGRQKIKRWTWNHVALVFNDKELRCYLNGELEFKGRRDGQSAPALRTLFIGGRCDRESNWQGRLDEVAVFQRELTEEDVQLLSLSTGE